MFIKIYNLITYPNNSNHEMVYDKGGGYKTFSDDPKEYKDDASFTSFKKEIVDFQKKSKENIINEINDIFNLNVEMDSSYSRIQQELVRFNLVMLLLYNEEQ